MAQQPKIIFLSGVGGTGKTMLARALHLTCEGVVLAPSFTRQVYAENGFSSEADLRTDFDRFVEVQHHMVEQFPVFVRKMVREHSGARAIVFQRSPSCYGAHLTTELPSMCVPHQVYAGVHRYINRYPNTSVFHCTYPAPWHLEGGATNDGFRLMNGNRDSALEAEMLYIIRSLPLDQKNTAMVHAFDTFDLVQRVNDVVVRAGLQVKAAFRQKT